MESSSSKTLVLIHGGTFGGSCWNLLLPHLQHAALAVDLPGRGRHPGNLKTMSSQIWADSVISDMDETGIERAVMVGHSLGGITLNALAACHPGRVAALIFVACPFPNEGGSCASACTGDVYRGIKAAWDAGGRETPAADRTNAVGMFTNDMDGEMIDRMCADMVPDSLTVLMEPQSLGGLRRGIPAFYVKLLQDHASPTHIQEAAIAVIQPNLVRTLNSGHMAMYTQPEALAAILDELVSAI